MSTATIDGRPSTITPGERHRLNDLWTELAGKAGIHDARTNQRTALEVFEQALTAKRAVDSEVRGAAERLTAARVGVEWELKKTRFKAVGNKTVLVTPGEDDTPMTAPEVKEWIATEAGNHPDVIEAAVEHRACLDDQEVARDAVVVADKRLSLAKYDLQAAVALLNTLTNGITNGGTQT